MSSTAQVVSRSTQNRATDVLLATGFAVFAIAWLIPGHSLPWTGFKQELAAALAFVFVAASALTSNSAFRWPWLATLAAVTATVALLQWGAGIIVFQMDATLAAAYLVGFAICIVAGATMGSGEWRDRLARGWCWSTLFAAGVSCTMASWQWLTGRGFGWFLEPPVEGGRVFANLAQPNLLATLLLWGVAACLYLYETQQLKGRGTTVCIAVLGCSVVMTQSRTAWFLVGFAVIWWWVMRRRAALRASPWVVVCAAALFFAAIPVEREVYGLLHPESQYQVRQLQGNVRWQYWQVLLDAAIQGPWYGYGWGQVAVAQHAAPLGDSPPRGAATHSHNLLLDLLVENGLVIGTLVAMALVGWLLAAMRRCKDGGSWALLLALGAVLWHAMLEYPLHYLMFLLPTGLLMGVLSTQGAHQTSATRTWLRPTYAALLASLVIFTALVRADYVWVNRATQHLQTSASKPIPASGGLLILDGWESYFSTATDQGGGSGARRRAIYRHVAERFGFPRSWTLYARRLALDGQSAEAADALAYLCRINPRETCHEELELWKAAAVAEPSLRAVLLPK